MNEDANNKDIASQNSVPLTPILPQKTKTNPVLVSVVVLAVVGLIVGGMYFLSVRSELGKQSVMPTEKNQQEKWLYFSDFYDIRDIVFDNDTLWIASIAGLHKYSRQGNLVKTYTAVDGLPTVATAVIKIGNKIYIGTQGGVAVLDPSTDKFNYLYDKTDHALNGNINHFEYDGKKLWMTTFGGLRSFDIITSEWKSYGHRDSDFTTSDKSVFLIERANPTPVVWFLNKSTDQWTQEFQLPDYEWMHIDGNSKYVVATADPKSGNKKSSVLYFKMLPDGAWSEIKLPISGDGLRYRKLTIGEDDKVYLTYRGSNENMLAVYDLKQKEFNQYALGTFGDAGATQGSIYPDPFQRKIWLSSLILNYLDLDTKIIQYALPPERPLRFNNILVAQEGKVVVNTNAGAGIFNYQTSSFEKISSDQASEAEWVGDTVWLNLSDMEEMGGGEVKLGKYNINSKTIEVKTLEQSFSFVKHQESYIANNILLMSQIYENGKSTSRVVLFDFGKEKFESLLELDSSSLSTSFNSEALYSEKYGILINTKEGIWNLNPLSKEYKLLFNTPFMVIFTRVLGNKVVVLSDTGALYKWDDANTGLIQIWNFQGPQFGKPFSFEIYKNSIALKSVEQLTQFNPGADYGFGPGGFSFYLNKLVLLNFDGSLLKTLDSSNGMMQVDFSNALSDGTCLWFAERGIWAYCK